jgi:hypothetical protein
MCVMSSNSHSEQTSEARENSDAESHRSHEITINSTARSAQRHGCAPHTASDVNVNDNVESLEVQMQQPRANRATGTHGPGLGTDEDSMGVHGFTARPGAHPNSARKTATTHLERDVTT